MKGFSEAVAAKDVLYEERITLSQEDQEELNRRLAILHGLTYNGKTRQRQYQRDGEVARHHFVVSELTHLPSSLFRYINYIRWQGWHMQQTVLILLQRLEHMALTALLRQRA